MMRSFLYTIAVTAAGMAQTDLKVGDSICLEGFIMDVYCIERGTLFDNPSVKSLVNPEKHSYHCLVDVSQCTTSGYEVLMDPAEGSDVYTRGIHLDDEGNEQVMALARATGAPGFCSTCTGPESTSPSRGFRATVNGTITSLGDESTPVTIKTVSVEDSSVGCGDFIFVPPNIVTKAGGLNTKIFLHGSLMIISWGWMLPSGVIIAKLFKHRPNGLWFKIHRVVQPLGLLIATVAWIIALVNFDVFSSTGGKAYYHGVLGITVMTIGLIQPINAFVRPHPPLPGDPTTTSRLVWEIVHQSLGYFASLLAVMTIFLGTLLVPAPSDQLKFQLGYGIGVGVALLLLVVCLVVDKRNYQEEIKDESPPLLGCDAVPL